MPEEKEPSEEEMTAAVKAAIPETPPPAPQKIAEYLPLEDVAVILQTEPKDFVGHFNSNTKERNIRTWKEQADKLYFSRLAMCNLHMAECNIFEDDPKKDDNFWSRVQSIVDVGDKLESKLGKNVLDLKSYSDAIDLLQSTRNARVALKDKASQYRLSVLDYNKLLLAKQSIDHNFLIVIISMLSDQQADNTEMGQKIRLAVGELAKIADKYV